MSNFAMVRQMTKRVLRRCVPLSIRQRAAVWIGHRPWVPGHHWWSMELVRDLAQRDPNAYHRFLWRNHLGYAETYEVDVRFGEENMHPSRVLLFEDVVGALQRCGVEVTDVRSVFEVGCSMGYLLRYCEEKLFPKATVVDGIDVDQYAVQEGQRHLRQLDSNVRLAAVDMESVAEVFPGQRYDVAMAAGVLMYLTRSGAEHVVSSMLRRTDRMVVLAGLAHPATDNAQLGESVVREEDGSFVHNFDQMIERNGWQVVYRRWEGAQHVDGNSIYFVLGAPGRA